jgi:hypothetical protein
MSGGFLLLEDDYDSINEAIQIGMTMEDGSPEDIANCQAIGQIFRVGLFPSNTASYGYYDSKRGSPFHLVRYQLMGGK